MLCCSTSAIIPRASCDSRLRVLRALALLASFVFAARAFVSRRWIPADYIPDDKENDAESKHPDGQESYDEKRLGSTGPAEDDRHRTAALRARAGRQSIHAGLGNDKRSEWRLSNR